MKYFSVLPSTIVSRGATCYLISDLEDGTYSEIPLEWGRILEKQRIFIMDEKDLDNSISSIGDKEMISFLVDNNFAIITSFKPSFLGYNFEN